MKRYIANLITGCRILCSILMISFPVFSARFYAAYLICGLSNMADGAAARKTNSSSPFGAVFDTAADFVFVSASFVKLVPHLSLSKDLLIWIAVIAIIKSVSIAAGFIKCKKPVAVHSVMNKLTGFLLFLLPLSLNFIALKYSSVLVCTVATAAAIEEGYIVVKNVKPYAANGENNR